jgi:deoxyribose-phosphate aldolase
MSDGGPDPGDVRRAIEHTALAAVTTEADVARLCGEALGHGFGGVCVMPQHVATCRAGLAGSGVRVVTVVGFPLGAHRTEVKVREAELALADGAHELDVVMRVGSALAGRYAEVRDDLAAVVAVAAARGAVVKVILETGALDDGQKLSACAAALEAGAGFVKTCTGFGPGHATVHDVALLVRAAAGRAQVKASGGIRTLADARALLVAGATRLGTSQGVAIARELSALARG